MFGSLLFIWPRYTRLPGQETTVSATRLRCSFSIGTRAEWLIPAVERPLTATIMSPHLEYEQEMTCYRAKLEGNLDDCVNNLQKTFKYTIKGG